jgi:hypothetical protein
MLLDKEIDPDELFDEGRGHLLGQLPGKHLVGFSGQRESNLDREVGQVGRGRPETRRSHLGVDMNFALLRTAFDKVDTLDRYSAWELIDRQRRIRLELMPADVDQLSRDTCEWPPESPRAFTW